MTLPRIVLPNHINTTRLRALIELFESTSNGLPFAACRKLAEHIDKQRSHAFTRLQLSDGTAVCDMLLSIIGAELVHLWLNGDICLSRPQQVSCDTTTDAAEAAPEPQR